MNENKKVLNVDIDNLEYVGGDGVEYERYLDKTTGKEYEVDLILERDWATLVEVK
tara:strand:- start:418 stop:582 length:165 start_codon:yes stop_codon:yes gene_type:complete